MLQEAVDDYMASLAMNENGQTGNNQNTIVAYRNDLNQLCAYLDQQSITNWPQVTREQIAAYLLAMREQQSYRPTTIARKLAAFKSFFRFLHSSGQITSDPIERLDAPHIRKEFPSVLSPEQIRCLFQQIEVETPAGQRDVAMLQMLCATGMRVTELVSLDLKDFDVTQGTVLCPGRNGRMKRERVLPLPPVAVEATQQYLTTVRPQQAQCHPDEESLFLNHHGERLTRQGFWLIIKGYARSADITTITPHMLRHSFALLMVKGGMELRSVQERLGHSHISTTQVYSQLAREEKKD